MEQYREKIEEYLKELDHLGEHNYKELEVAIVLFLRSDLDSFKDITDKQLEEIYDIIAYNDSILDINKEDIDNIIENEEN